MCGDFFHIAPLINHLLFFNKTYGVIMNKRQENKLTMYEGLLTLLQANSAEFQSIGGFSDAVTQFSSIVSEVKAKSNETEVLTAGKVAAKHEAEDLLVGLLLPVCSALYIFARKQDNTEIKERANITEAKLRAMRDTELASYGESIADLANTNASALALMGITAEMIADLKGKAQAYTAAIGARESSVAERKGARGSMNELFDKADELLNEDFDRYFELLRPTDTELYNKYFSARVVKDMGMRHRPVATPPTPVPVAAPAK